MRSVEMTRWARPGRRSWSVPDLPFSPCFLYYFYFFRFYLLAMGILVCRSRVAAGGNDGDRDETVRLGDLILYLSSACCSRVVVGVVRSEGFAVGYYKLPMGTTVLSWHGRGGWPVWFAEHGGSKCGGWPRVLLLAMDSGSRLGLVSSVGSRRRADGYARISAGTDPVGGAQWIGSRGGRR